MKLLPDETPLRRRRCALHEAGHVVVAHALGIKLLAAWVEQHGYTGTTATLDRNVERRDYVTYTMAGPAADGLFLTDELKAAWRPLDYETPPDMPAATRRSDIDSAVETAAANPAASIDIADCYQRARLILEQKQAAVYAVAAALLKPENGIALAELVKDVTGKEFLFCGPGEVPASILIEAIEAVAEAGTGAADDIRPTDWSMDMLGFFKGWKKEIEQDAEAKRRRLYALVVKCGEQNNLSTKEANELKTLTLELGHNVDEVEGWSELARERQQLAADVAAEKERVAALEAAGRASAAYEEETNRIIEERRRGGWERDQVMKKCEAAVGRTVDAARRTSEIEALRPELWGKPPIEVQARQRHLVHLWRGQPEPKLALATLFFGYMMGDQKDAKNYLGHGAVNFDGFDWVPAPGQSKADLDELVALARANWRGTVPGLTYIVERSDYRSEPGASSFPLTFGAFRCLEDLIEETKEKQGYGGWDVEGWTLIEVNSDGERFTRAKMILHPGQPVGEFNSMLRKVASAYAKAQAQRYGRPLPPPDDEPGQIVERIEHQHRPGLSTVTAVR